MFSNKKTTEHLQNSRIFLTDFRLLIDKPNTDKSFLNKCKFIEHLPTVTFLFTCGKVCKTSSRFRHCAFAITIITPTLVRLQVFDI